MADYRQSNLYILDFNKTTIGVLSNRMPFSLPFYEDLQERSLDEFTDTLTFKVPANHDEASKINGDNYILYPERSGQLKLYKIQEVTDIHEDGQVYKEVYCELSAQDDLIKDVVRPVTLNSATLNDVITHILSGSDWSVGNVEDFGLQDYKIDDYPTKLEALITAVKDYGAELEFSYQTVGTTVIGQTVNAYSMVGNDTGKTFMFGKDLKGIERAEDRSKVVTAMIGVGKSQDDVPLTFANETETFLEVPEGYVKPEGVDWVGSIEALNKYSKNGKHVFGVYKDDNAQSAYELFQNTLEALKKYSVPLMTYKATVALLDEIAGYSHEMVQLGDRVLVQDKKVTPELYLQARIRKLSRSITSPQDDEVELGDYIPVVPPVNSVIQAVQAKIRQNEDTWNKAEQIPQLQQLIDEKPSMDEVFSVQANRIKVRYIRDYINGSDVDAVNQWAELQVWKAGNNIALGILPTASGTVDYPERVTDGTVDYAQLATMTETGSQYIEIDLGSAVENVEYIKVWHNYSDSRTYTGHMVDVSEDGVNWVRLYNSDKNGSHAEDTDGFLVAVNSSAITNSTEKTQTQVVSDVADLKDFKQSTEYELTQKVDVTAYNTKVNELESNIADKADLTYVDGELQGKADASSTYTKTEVDNAVNSRVSTETYTTDHNNIVTELDNHETRITQTEDDISLKADAQTVSDLEGRVADNEASITANANEIALRVTEDEAKKIAKTENSIDFRYVRYIGQGTKPDATTGANSSTKLVEITVLDSDGNNVAQGKTVTAGDTNATNLTFITDGVMDRSQFADIGNGDTSVQWAMIDLGQVYSNVDSIKVYHATDEVYRYEMQVSNDSINWINIFDTDNGEYTASDAGFEIFVNQQKAIHSFASAIRVNAEGISSKADAYIVDDLGTRISTAEEKIADDAIVNTVMSAQVFTDALGAKADATALDSKANVDDLDDVKDDLKNNYATKTELQQTSDEFDFKFQSSGGINIINNSVGFANTDFWAVTGSVLAIQNAEIEQNGAGSGFQFNGATITQTIPVRGGKYAISGLVKKGLAGTGYIKVTYDNGLYEQKDFLNGTAYDYEQFVILIDIQGTEITIEVNGDIDSGMILTSLMGNTGDVPLQWQHAVGEVYNANITFNSNGITVKSSDNKGYTAITPEEFAGYYEVDGVQEKVFTLNKDVTEVAKLQADNEIKMSPMKIVPIITDTLRGWAFVADDE